MGSKLTRRDTILASTGLLGLGLTGCASTLVSGPYQPFVDLESQSGGKLGACVLDLNSGQRIAHHGDDRFGMCSAFKLLLAGVILHEGDQRRLDLAEVLTFSEADMVSHAPITQPRLADGGMTIEELAEGTQKTSDNVAANLLLKRLGGPQGFTARLRDFGDPVTRVDRFEPSMNFVPPGEVRDTSSPNAFSDSLARLLTTNYLSPTSRSKIIDWMVDTHTGSKRIRAGIPSDWKSGDKTGTAQAAGMKDKTNDIAFFWPEGKKPVIVCGLYEGPFESEDRRPQDEAVLAKLGEIAVAWYKGL